LKEIRISNFVLQDYYAAFEKYKPALLSKAVFLKHLLSVDIDPEHLKQQSIKKRRKYKS